jgi:sensor histidine kinase regulating citrate/malate metabolism
MKKLSFLNYLMVITIITVIFGVTYATVQQSYRTAANDPQIQIARDINASLQQGKTVEGFLADTIDIGQSLSTFVALYDANGKPVRSSGDLDGKMPELPAGVFEFAKSHGEHQVTWQPRSGVRMAMVIVSSTASPVGFVAAGRSLQEVEVREHNLIIMIFTGWIVCSVLILIHAEVQFYKSSKLKILPEEI